MQSFLYVKLAAESCVGKQIYIVKHTFPPQPYIKTERLTLILECLRPSPFSMT